MCIINQGGSSEKVLISFLLVFTPIDFRINFFDSKVFNEQQYYFQLEDIDDKEKALMEYTKGHMRKATINKKNLKQYIDAYMNRVDISGKLAAELRCDALLVVGTKSSQCAAAEYMHSHMDKVCM